MTNRLTSNFRDNDSCVSRVQLSTENKRKLKHQVKVTIRKEAHTKTKKEEANFKTGSNMSQSNDNSGHYILELCQGLGVSYVFTGPQIALLRVY